MADSGTMLDIPLGGMLKGAVAWAVAEAKLKGILTPEQLKVYREDYAKHFGEGKEKPEFTLIYDAWKYPAIDGSTRAYMVSAIADDTAREYHFLLDDKLKFARLHIFNPNDNGEMPECLNLTATTDGQDDGCYRVFFEASNRIGQIASAKLLAHYTREAIELVAAENAVPFEISYIDGTAIDFRMAKQFSPRHISYDDIQRCLVVCIGRRAVVREFYFILREFYFILNEEGKAKELREYQNGQLKITVREDDHG